MKDTSLLHWAQHKYCQAELLDQQAREYMMQGYTGLACRNVREAKEMRGWAASEVRAARRSSQKIREQGQIASTLVYG